MERKFKSKLVAVKASEVRKQAIVHLKESIELNKFKQIDPIDYDSYIEQNIANLRKDTCTKQLIILPSDDVYAEADDFDKTIRKSREENAELVNVIDASLNSFKNQELSLFVDDCLKTYFNKKYEIKYKYHLYGGNYRQLPSFFENSILIENSKNFNDASAPLILPELSYEIDAENSFNKNSILNKPHTSSSSNMNKNQSKNETLFEKNGWLNHKYLSNLKDNQKNLKKRYFQLRLVEAASIRGLILEPRYRPLNVEIQDDDHKKVYVLECFKEIPHANLKLNPKYRIIFDYNIKDLKNTSNKNGSAAYTFELCETSIETSKDVKHIFMADCQKTFDVWFTTIEKIISLNQKTTRSNNNEMMHFNEKLLSPISSLNSGSLSSSSSASASSSCTSSVSDASSSLNQLNSSDNSNQSSGRNSHFLDEYKPVNNLNQQLVENFNLDKYLNENDEDLLAKSNQTVVNNEDSNKNEHINLFDLYPRLENDDLIDEETELESIWPEQAVGRKLLLEFDHFKLNLSFPILSKDVKQSGGSFRGNINNSFINPEIFYLIFAIYDARNNQKISENFYHIPNYDFFYNQLTGNTTSSEQNINSMNYSSSNRNSLCNLKNKHSMFSLDGKQFSDDIQSTVLYNNTFLVKLNFLNKIKKALFTIPEVHEDIFLVVRIEKCLDGAGLHSSLQPYLIPMSECNRVKAAIKLNKKMQQLLKTKLVDYRQPFAWAAKPIYKKIKHLNNQSFNFELDTESKFVMYEQDIQTLNDEHLFKYLHDYRSKEKYLHKLTELNASLKLFINDFPADLFENKNSFINKTNLVSSSYIIQSKNDYTLRNSNEFILSIDYFDPILPNYLLNDTNSSTTQYSPNRISTVVNNENSSNKNPQISPVNNDSSYINNSNCKQLILPSITNEHINLIKKAKLLKTNDSFRSFLFVYPKNLKYEQQKVFSKARNIVIKTELRENDFNCNDDLNALKCIINLNKNFFINSEENLFTNNHLTQITHHNKNPQFYDEIKILLPLNLNDKHHLLFKFYHVSCSNAKYLTSNSLLKSEDTPVNASNDSTSINSNSASLNSANKSVETLVGYAWLPIFKNGRLINGEKQLPIAQSITSDYLSFEQIGLGQSVSSSDIKWVDGMKPLFKVNLSPLSTIHTTDPHVANFYNQSEKLISSFKFNEQKGVPSSIGKKKAPLIESIISSQNSQTQTIQINTLIDKNDCKFILPNSNKEIINNSIKGLHATEIYTIIKFLPSLLSRILKTLITTVSSDVSIHSVRALLFFVWQATSIGKMDMLKSFIKYIFYIDYTPHFTNNNNKPLSTVHNELISNLVVLIKQILPIQDLCQMNRLYKNCWFCLEITLKSICLYTIQFKQFNKNSSVMPVIERDFYDSLQSLYELLIESIIKFGSMVTTATKDPEFINSYKSCNRSLAMFIKKSLNVLNRKFLFSLINKYLENFHLCDKNLIEIKFDFIRIICNHEHYVSFSLPIKKAVSNINEFADMKHEFVLSDQFRQFHFPVGILLSQLCVSLNENKEQRKLAISIVRNILSKHSYDNRYNDDKNKQARIASLYLPLIDVLLENLNRININLITTPLTSIKSSNQLNNDVLTNRASSSITSQTGVTHSSNGTSSSTSLLNENISLENNRPNETSSVLGAIAGIGNSKLQNHLEAIIGPISDSDSLSSADDTQFKNLNKRSSSLITGSNNSDNMTLNNSNSVNVSNLLIPGLSSNISSMEQSLISKSYCLIRKDKLETNEVKDLLICVVYVLKNISHDSLLGLWLNYDDNEFVDFLTLLELCLKTFKYRGKTNIQTLNAISRSKDVKALIRSPRNNIANLDVLERIGNSAVHFNKSINENEENSLAENNILNSLKQSIMFESNLCHQVGLVIMNILSLILIHQKDKLCENHGDNSITKRLVEIYFYLLQSNQSETIKLKTFASLRLLINKTPTIFLDGNSMLCANLCLKLLKCFNSKFQSIRLESCIVLYLLMRKNYEHTKHKSINRVHSQTIISLSQLIGTMKLSTSIEVLDCLLILNNLASNDKSFQNTRFSLEVDDLTKRIRNIFMATSQMKNYEDDTEMLIDSQYSLAKSYANCLELRRTWLDSMATIHIKEKNYAEAAYCYLHIAALVAENLKHQGMYTLGCSVFKKITPNIELEEELNNNNDAMKNGDNYTLNDLNEVQYTQTQLLEYLCKSADMLKLAERYDSLPNIFKLAVAIYETNRDYEHLQQMHQNIQRAYSYMAERDQRASEKPLGAYYRISFYGKMFNDENNKVYIYKEPGNTKLFEICDRLRKIYGKRFGSMDLVEILRDSRKPSELKLDTTNKNYIQVTSVQPYFDANDLAERINFFDKNNNLKKFFYEIPYQLKEYELQSIKCDDLIDENQPVLTVTPIQHAELLRLCKRKIILETSHWFPYVKKRILVIYEKPIDLNPLETAIDEIKQKIESFQSILRKKDLTLLELFLQGGIIPQVHKGPLAYAEAFLEPNEMNKKYTKELKKEFKNTFKSLIDSYQKGIEMYGQLANKNVTVHTNEENSNRLSLNVSNLINTTITSNPVQSANKYLEMFRLLQEKFNEVENSFRNLLLIDGDFDLYQQQLKSHSQTSRTQILADINNTSILTSSNA